MRLIDADALEERLADKNNGCVGECECCEHYLKERWDKGWCGLIAHAPTVGGWTNVKDKLPEKYEAVIVSVIGHDFEPYASVAWISADNEWDTDDNLLCRCSWEVTHWRPMPELPPEVTEDEV